MTFTFLFLTVVLLIAILLVTRPACTPTRPRPRPRGRGHAHVVHDIPAGRFGQIRLAGVEPPLLLAARSASDEFLPAGTAVEIVDDSRSVVLVRPLATREEPSTP